MDKDRHLIEDKGFDIFERASYGKGCEIQPLNHEHDHNHGEKRNEIIVCAILRNFQDFLFSLLFGLRFSRQASVFGDQKGYFGGVGAWMQERVHPPPGDVTFQVPELQFWVRRELKQFSALLIMFPIILDRKPAASIVKCRIWIRPSWNWTFITRTRPIVTIGCSLGIRSITRVAIRSRPSAVTASTVTDAWTFSATPVNFLIEHPWFHHRPHRHQSHITIHKLNLTHHRRHLHNDNPIS